jgi:hypothetical protein
LGGVTPCQVATDAAMSSMNFALSITICSIAV